MNRKHLNNQYTPYRNYKTEGMPKAIPTKYKGYFFRSRLEARWAVFFDACGVEWEYEPEGFDLGNGMYYLPDFLLHNVDGRAGGDLFVEVKGQMTDIDALKINRFAQIGAKKDGIGKSTTPILVVGKIPEGEDAWDICDYISGEAYSAKDGHPYPFNFGTIDGDHFAAHPGINKRGNFELFGDDSNYLADMDETATARAYKLARQSRFEFGATPKVRRIK